MPLDAKRKPLAEGDSVELADGRHGRVVRASLDGHLTVMLPDGTSVAIAADKVTKMSIKVEDQIRRVDAGTYSSMESTCLSCSTSVAMDSLGRLEPHRHGGGWTCVGSGREPK
jgi:hypothetical protein